jgi:reactive intermediate/imine deaminase
MLNALPGAAPSRLETIAGMATGDPPKGTAFRLVQPPGAEPAGGRPYSAALRVGNWLFIAGQAALDADGDVVGRGDADMQWRQCLENIRSIVEAAGGSMSRVVRLGIYVTDMRHHLAFSEIRREYFEPPYPTATVVGVTALAGDDWLIEIEATAYLG